jgi:hypothetical protein
MPSKALSCRHSQPYRALAALVALLSTLVAPTRVFSTEWLQDGREPPLHPSLITTDYKGKSYPVTGVSGELPEIEADGKPRRLHLNQSYQTQRAMGYVSGYIHFKAQNASSETRKMVYQFVGSGANSSATIPGGTISASGNYECTLVSSESHADCYIAVVFFRKNSDGGPDMRSDAIAFRQIGGLVAGQETHLKINCAYIAPPGTRYYFFPLIFSKGLEIRSDQSEIAARFFRRQEMISHDALLAEYRQKFQAADRPALAYLRVAPQLPVGIDPHNLPATIDAKFVVTETGEVDSLEIGGTLDPQVARAIRRALNGWLFLPRLKKGIPVRSMIELPLSFDRTSNQS